MKKLIMAMAAAGMLLSCGNESDDTIKNYVTVTFNTGDVTMHSFTRASLSDLTLIDLWVFDYMDDELQATVHQTQSDDDFGAPSLALAYGTHHLYFVASRGADPVTDTDAKTITWSTVRDTFWASMTLEVSPTSATSQSVSLSRVVGRLRIDVTDVVPTGSAKFVITPATWYYGLKYDTGTAVSSSASPISINIPASYIGTTNLTTSFYTISPSALWQTDVEVSLLASDESVIGCATIPDVPLQRNHVTRYRGGVLSAGMSLSVSSTDEWVEDDYREW